MYTRTLPIVIPLQYASATLEAQLVDAGGTNVGGRVTAGFRANNFFWAGSFPDGFVGAVQWQLVSDHSIIGVETVNVEDDPASLSQALSGPSSVTLTFVDSSDNPVPGVIFTIQGQGFGSANPDGIAAFGLPDGDYVVIAAPTNGVLFASTDLEVDGTTTLTIDGTGLDITPPESPDEVTGYGTIRDGGVPVPNGKFQYQMVHLPDDMPAGNVDYRNVKTVTADSDGDFEILHMVQGAEYHFRANNGEWGPTLEAPEAAEWAIGPVEGGVDTY